MQHNAKENGEPARFDQRFIRKVVELSDEETASLTKDDYDLISRVFHLRNGSWERILKGSPEDIALLKKVIKFGLKNGHIGPNKCKG